jgi:hypothetical protein
MEEEELQQLCSRHGRMEEEEEREARFVFLVLMEAAEC